MMTFVGWKRIKFTTKGAAVVVSPYVKECITRSIMNEHEKVALKRYGSRRHLLVLFVLKQF